MAHWTCGDAQQIDHLFRQSGLYRAKWDQKHSADGSTYGEMTIAKALAGYRDAAHSGVPPRAVPALGAPVERFPTEVLPGPLRAFVQEGAKETNCPEDFIAIPLLVAAGAAIGTRRALMVKPHWIEYPRLFVALLAKTGERKSPALALALSMVKAQQRELL